MTKLQKKKITRKAKQSGFWYKLYVFHTLGDPEGQRSAIRPRTKVILGVCAAVFLLFIITYDFPSERELEKEPLARYAVGDPQFVRSIDNLLGPGLVEGNNIVTMLNGDQAFPAMLEAIRSAQKSITFESYIYLSGDIGKRFTHALVERARAGVRVHLLLDSVGSGRVGIGSESELKKAGVDVVRYHRVFWTTVAKFNNRTHRKILIVDGKIGFTGGMGIDDHWIGNADSPDHWRDTHFKVEGPVVAQMQAVFMDNWMETRGEVLDGEDYFPDLEKKGDIRAQVCMSSPKQGSENARLLYLMSIAAARKSILMSNAYFVPDALSIKTLVHASQRGVKISIIAPGKLTDTKSVRYASRSRWGDLLKAGVKIYEYQPTMFHCKVMVVDGMCTLVGSTNFDNRSFRLDDEINLDVLDEAFAKKQTEIFYNDLSKSKLVTEQDWKQRSVGERLMELLAGLFHNQV
jgi:Phosphatidylserine/phosphatidylglycerophosphate/cardiolipin synthases and related enzymes